MTRRIVFASRNRQKFEEMRFLFQDFPVELLFGGDFSALAVEETGDSYSANALLKAGRGRKSFAARPGDDSGLEVEALALGTWASLGADRPFRRGTYRVASAAPRRTGGATGPVRRGADLLHSEGRALFFPLPRRVHGAYRPRS